MSKAVPQGGTRRFIPQQTWLVGDPWVQTFNQTKRIVTIRLV